MAQLRQQQDALEGLNTHTLVISFDSGGRAQAWLEETASPFPLLLDPERAVYGRYGLDRSLRRSWNLATFWRYLQFLGRGRRWRGIQGDSGQLGGDFIVDSGGIIRLAYRSHDPADRPPVERLLAVLRSLAVSLPGR